MEELKIGNNKLSKKTGISKSTISRYCNGLREPCYDYLCAICIALRLQACRQRHLFALGKIIMPDELHSRNKRDYIIREFLDGCPYDKRYSVDTCNIRLKTSGNNPLTELFYDKEEVQHQ